ncbi:MAG TPA: hypothetical protein VEN29_21965 [Casimicrobiaceae bacterium]|nr:hypothetical protein [Casimicrobiaceae bacterium]
MKIHSSILSALFAGAACVLSGCATTPQVDAEKRAPEVTVYKARELANDQYEVVSHLWVDSWRTAFSTPTYPSEDEAVASLQAEAARLGADGLVNVTCFDAGGSLWFRSDKPTLLCYANAIRVRRS